MPTTTDKDYSFQKLQKFIRTSLYGINDLKMTYLRSILSMMELLQETIGLFLETVLKAFGCINVVLELLQIILDSEVFFIS